MSLKMTCQALYGVQKKEGKSSILCARCRSKFALVNLTRTTASDSEAECCYDNTLRGVKERFIEHLPSEIK